MITTLTPEQEKGIFEWQQHCLKIGRDTSPVNKKLTEESWIKFYKVLGKKEPKFWYCQSPLQAQIIINFFPEIQKICSFQKGANISDNIRAGIRANINANIKANINDNIRANINANIRANINANIRANINANIRADIGANIGADIGANIGADIGANINANIYANINANIRADISDNIRAGIRANIKANIRDNILDNSEDMKFQYIETYSWCQHDINWIAYYKYYEKSGLLPTDKNFEIFNIWYDLACSCGWCYTFENMVFVCEKPCELHINNSGRLHKDGDMALRYSDGYGLYMLNGIRAPKWVVETEAEKIDPKLAIDEENTDIQREIIRKIGAERMLKKLDAKELSAYKDDKTGLTYKLYRMTIGDIDRKYLYFEHASIKGVFYTKGVPPEVTTALSGYAWTRKLLDREELKNIDIAKEAELIANLPAKVS